MHSVSPVWQRDLLSILPETNLLQITDTKQNEIQGYVLFKIKDDSVRIYDLGASDIDVAKHLLSSLQSHVKEIHSTNEPTDNPIAVAFDECNLSEYDRQYELGMML